MVYEHVLNKHSLSHSLCSRQVFGERSVLCQDFGERSVLCQVFGERSVFCQVFGERSLCVYMNYPMSRTSLLLPIPPPLKKLNQSRPCSPNEKERKKGKKNPPKYWYWQSIAADLFQCLAGKMCLGHVQPVLLSSEVPHVTVRLPVMKRHSGQIVKSGVQIVCHVCYEEKTER